MNKSSIPVPDQTRQLSFEEPIEDSPQSSDGKVSASTGSEAQSRSSAKSEESLPTSTDTSSPTLKPISDDAMQLAAIARGALMQLKLAGLVYMVKVPSKNEVRVCFKLDQWDEDLKLK